MKEIKTEKTRCIICNSNSFDILTIGTDYEYNTCDNIFFIVQCNSCGHIYLNPKPTLKEFSTIYSDKYYAYHFPNNKFSLAKIGKELIEKKYINLYKGLIGYFGSILDVGCGDGRLLSILKSNKECDWDLYGLDFNENGNRKAEEKGIKVYNGKFEEFDFQDKKFDLIIMNELFEHLYDPIKSLNKVKKILKQDGFLIIETPCLGSWDHKLFKDSYWGGYHIPRHTNIFSRKTIRMILEKNGFKILKEESLLSPPFWILSIHNKLYDSHWNKKIVNFFNFYNPFLLSIFTIIDLIQKRFGHTSTMRIIARRENGY